MADEIQLTRHDIEAKIVKRCWEDEEFRKEFVSDPAGSFVKHLEIPAASLPRIVIHEEAAGSWHIVVPQKPTNVGELSEDELERVAGGVTPVVIPAVVIASIATAIASAGATASVSASAIVSIKRGW